MLRLVEGFSGAPRCSTTHSRVQSLSRMIVVTLWMLLGTTKAQISGDWPYRIVEGARELGDCEGLGFPNATRNSCGYCTLGNTGLLSNHSMDCSGSCSNEKVVDCAGICGGTASIDECSGKCIGGSTGYSEYDVRSNRDCRGYCTSSRGLFYTDDCGVCHTGTSPFQDCTNKCHLPGFKYMMAKLVCGRCVGSNTGVAVSDVLDACGNCKSDTVECPCNGTGKPDVCGVCNGGGKSCMKVVSVSPRALPANIKANIIVEGAFKGRIRNLRCILQFMVYEEIANTTEVVGSSNGMRVNCQVKLKTGTYRVGVKLDVGDPPETDFVEESELLVYEEIEYSTMTPMKAVFDREGSQKLVVTFSGGRVPNLPLICIITGEGWPVNQKLFPSEANTLDSCVIPCPQSSMKLNVAPSFNGIHPFKKSFTLKFYASSPEMKENYIAEDGHAAVITFDRPVNLCDMKECVDILNSETLTRIGNGALCEWATKQQLIITVQNPINTNPLSITFKKGALKQDGQKYALPKTESRTVDVYYPRPMSNAQLSISGPFIVPYCGTFTLVGHFSSPKGDAQYYWTVYRGDRRPTEDILANALLTVRTTSLSLNASLLEVDMNYTFVLTAEHPVNEKYEGRHIVCRKPYIGPLVTAYSDVMSQPSVTVDQKITLHAELTLPECASRTENMHLMWAVNNPEVKFDFQHRNLLMYEIQPYSLPENSEIIFTAYAFFSNMLNVTHSFVHIRVEKFKLKATIKGTVKRVVGNKEGNLVLESEVSSLGFPVVYQWKCYQYQGEPICYNYQINATEPLLLSRVMQAQPNLEIPCNSLKAAQVLTFELQVFMANNKYQYSQVATTYVYVENRNIPQVVIDSVIADGTHNIERHPNTGAYSIPAGLPVAVHATITPVKSNLKSVKWEVKGFSSSFTYTTVNGITILSLEEGFLVGHGIYLIGLSACDGKGVCGIANLTIHAVAGIALCKLETDPYVEYEMISAVVKSCSIPLGRQPVTYQIFLHTSESVFPLTAPQTPTVFKLIGPSLQSENGTQMSVQVCDKYSLCKLFIGPHVKVTRSGNLLEDRKIVLNKAIQSMEISDPLTALSLYLTVLSEPNYKLPETEILNMLNASRKASFNRYLNAGQLSLIYSAMLPVVKHENNKMKIKALGAIKKATKQAFGHKVKVPTSILTQGYSNVAEALLTSSFDSSISQKVEEVLKVFVQKISATAPLGSRIQLSSNNPGLPSSLIFRQLLDHKPIFIRSMSHNGMVEGSVKFEESVRTRVRNRPCKKFAECGGIVVALTLYPDNSPYPSKETKTSPTIDIMLRKPEDGLPFHLSDMTNAVRLTLTHTANTTNGQNEGMLLKCSYWNSQDKEWVQDGVLTYGITGSIMKCWSSHLTIFAVLEIYDGLSTGSIVGIVVTVLMGVFIIMMLAFFFLRKKQASNTRVSNEALQPKKRHSEKLQSMNSSVVRVKTITP